MEYIVSLSERNKKVYDKVNNKFKTSNSCAIVGATGTGKSYIAMELIFKNMGKEFLYLAPSNAILKQFKRNMAIEGLLGDVNPDNDKDIEVILKTKFPWIHLHTYQWFHRRQTEGKLDNIHYDYVICDEYHHTGGDKWYISLNDFKTKYKETKYFGMSATPQRLDGQSTLFSFDNDVVYEYSLAEAIVDGVLPIPKYIDYGIKYLSDIENCLDIIEMEYSDGIKKNNIIGEIKSFIDKVNRYDELPNILKQYISKNSKVLYFCPPSNKDNKRNKTKEIFEIYKLKDKMFSSIDSNAHYYISFSDLKISDVEEEKFLNDDYNGLRVLYTVNKYNEGVHQESIDTLIMGRGTTSVSLFYQQLGRALSAGKNLGIQPVVLDLVGNIHLYQDLVDEVRKLAQYKINRGECLPNNDTLDNFMSKFTIVDYEKEQSDFLCLLRANIKDNRMNNKYTLIIKWIERIEEYCETYKEWPSKSKKSMNNSIKDGTLSSQLLDWLSSSCYSYINDAFKYKDIYDNNGISLKIRLDILFKKYGKYTLKTVKEVEEYCNTYKEWPKSIRKDRRNGEKDNKSHVLSTWVKEHYNYNCDMFDYSNEVDENGVSLKIILDNLFKKYGRINSSSREYILYRVNQVKEFCETYKEWPKSGDNSKRLNSGITSNQLFNWLCTSNYNNKEKAFKYEHIKDENGISVKIVLDNLYAKYGRIKNKSDEKKIFWVKKLREYCEMYKEWPSQSSENKLLDGTTSIQLYNWLYVVSEYNYARNTFKYKYIKDEKGSSLKQIVDELYEKYGRINIFNDDAKIKKVDLIEKYCIRYLEWPRRDSNKMIDGIESSELGNWLKNSKYYSDFKYKDIIDINGISLKTRLDKLFNIFAGYKQNKRINDVEGINLYNAKNSKNLGLNLYYLIVALKNSYDYNDMVMSKYYMDMINNISLNSFGKVIINLDELINIFNVNVLERLNFYYIKYNSSLDNEYLSIMYKKLFDYENNLYSMNLDKSMNNLEINILNKRK